MRSYLLFLIIIALTFYNCKNELGDYTNTSGDYQIIPKPQTLKQSEGRFFLDKSSRISIDSTLQFEGDYLDALLNNQSEIKIPFETDDGGNIQLKLDPSISNDEGYSLSVQPNSILILGKTSAGIFYGIQSLKQLISITDGVITIPSTYIKDQPQFAYRGMHLDVARHFFPPKFIKRYIDFLALHKMNRFHWHLTDDQGWRIEIKKYPKLTTIGAWRNGTIEGHFPGTANDNKRYGGFYTQEEVKDIITYAAKRHITVIPEIELPGHSSAAIAAYPFLSCFPNEPTVVPNNMISEASKEQQEHGQPKIVQETWGVFSDVYCAGKEETFTFVDNVLQEVMALFPSKYIHIGGDECPKANWKRCPACQKRMKELGLANEHELQSYFIQRVEKFVNSKGKKIIGWDEILEGGLAPNATVMSWRGNSGGIAAAKADHDVIMSPNSHCYFDHYQSENKDTEPLAIGGFLPIEKVYAFDPVPKELDINKHRFILGGQANLWTEYIPDEAQAEYMLFPRMTALSEVLWTSSEQKDWIDFRSRLNHFKSLYEAWDINYYKHVFENSPIIKAN